MLRFTLLIRNTLGMNSIWRFTQEGTRFPWRHHCARLCSSSTAKPPPLRSASRKPAAQHPLHAAGIHVLKRGLWSLSQCRSRLCYHNNALYLQGFRQGRRRGCEDCDFESRCLIKLPQS
jgi:hypothetical protein